VAAGATHPKVIAWAREQLVRANKLEGVACKTDRERAEVLLRACQKKLWIPDPVGTEFMAGAHLLACDASTKDEICYLGSDCDELSALLGACFLAVGLNTLVVGHAYDRQQNIQHVLCAVRIPSEGGASAISGGQRRYTWLYADPSLPKLNLGEVTPFTRERVLSVPDIRVVCDSSNCFGGGKDYDPDELNFVSRGVFVGVDGPPERATFAWLGAPRVGWLGQEASASVNVQTSNAAANNVINQCQGTVAHADLSTGKARAETFERAGKCAAEALCEYYSGGAVPPGLCSKIAGPVLKAVVDVWNDLFGGPTGIDCSKVSTVDPCHPCSIFAWQLQKCGTPTSLGPLSVTGSDPYQACIKAAGLPPECAQWMAGATERARLGAIRTANDTVVLSYQQIFSDAHQQLAAKLGRPTTLADLPGVPLLTGTSDGYKLGDQELSRIDASSGIVIGRAIPAIAAAYQSKTGQPLQSKELASVQSGPQPAKKSSAVPVVAGLGLAGLAAWWFLR